MRSDRVPFQVYEGADERKLAWLKGPDEYAACLRRQYNPDGTPRTAADEATPDTVDVDTGERL